MEIHKIIDNIRLDLNQLGDETVRQSSQRFFKSDQMTYFYGVKSPEVKTLIKNIKNRF